MLDRKIKETKTWRQKDGKMSSVKSVVKTVSGAVIGLRILDLRKTRGIHISGSGRRRLLRRHASALLSSSKTTSWAGLRARRRRWPRCG